MRALLKEAMHKEAYQHNYMEAYRQMPIPGNRAGDMDEIATLRSALPPC